MRRREFIILLGSAAAAWPFAAHTQAGLRRVAVVMYYAQSDQAGQVLLKAFVETLARLGWSDGRNLVLDVRWVSGGVALYKSVAMDVTAASPDVILVMSNPLLAQFQSLTKTIPIVFTSVSDSVGAGFVSNIARPSGNITGFENFQPEIGGKWLGLLKEASPGISRVGILLIPEISAHAAFRQKIEMAAPTLGVQATAIAVHNATEIEHGIATFAEQPNGSLIVLPHPINQQNRDLTIALAARYRLPAIYPFRLYATSGGLISYGFDQLDQFRGAAGYVDRILKGEKPADLPVQVPTKYELVFNLKTAKAIGLVLSESLLVRADAVIE
jgi:putative ABC transport system substrate-binding protein